MPTENMQEPAHALFEYIKEVCQLTQQKVLDVEKQPGFVAMRKLDDPTCIKLFSRDKTDGNVERESDVLFTFHKPDFTQCPVPDALIEQWLLPGWNDFRKPLGHLDEIELPKDESDEAASDPANESNPQLMVSDEATESDPKVERFDEDSQRVAVYNEWAEVREAWVVREKHTEQIRAVFNDLFDMYNQYRQSPETMEIVIGNGFLTDKKNKDIKHPLFTKRVDLTLDPVKNTLTVQDSEEPSALYLPLFSVMEDVNVDVIRPLEKRAEDDDIHPLDHHEGGDLLKSVAHQLHSSSRYLGDGEEAVRAEERILVRWEPYVILRKRPDGTMKAIQAILDALAEGAEIPGSLVGILGGFDGPSIHIGIEGTSDENGTVDVGWEETGLLPLDDEDILLPKPANREQMQIVRQIDHLPAVLVQGPPGTGKTHTIANLLGHFLAQGKTVLVTSQTSKALAVLKDKVPEELQALCVAVLGDNRADIEESINTIIDRTSGVPYAAQRAKVQQLKQQRHQTLNELEKARNLVYAIRHKEFEPIVYDGDSWSPAKAAEYVSQHESLMGLIPGDICYGFAFPLTQQELEWLYQSNLLLSAQEEKELALALPSVEELMAPQQMADGIDLQSRLNTLLQNMNMSGRVSLAWKSARYAVIDLLTDQIYAKQGTPADEAALREMLTVYEEAIPGWAAFAMSDGAEDGLSRKRWEQLLNLIDETFSKGQPVLEKQLKRPIKINHAAYTSLVTPYKALLEDAEKHGHVKKGIFTKKEKKEVLEAVTIGGEMPESLEDIKCVLAYLELLGLRKQLGQLWDSLLASHGAKSFSDLGHDPERLCHEQAKTIIFWLNWEKDACKELCRRAEAAGIGDAILKPLSGFVSMTDEKAAQILRHIADQLVPAVNLLHLVNELYSFTHSKENTIELLAACQESEICRHIQTAMDEESAEQYEVAVNSLNTLFSKSNIQKQRKALLDRIGASAPSWANAIRNREGCHGDGAVPDDLFTAWKVRQLSYAIDEMMNTSLSDAEKRVSELTVQFRKDTERLATASAWCCLQQRVDMNPRIRQSLNGWKQTIAKIGKGTGKRAPALGVEARKLMMECQKAVPAWIMPVSSVMNSIDPATTKFDVIIVDEASQSDITASTILYMGKKIIIVGDDEQVSPLAVGLDEDKMQNLMAMLIKDKIPNAHLWDARTSLYDIAAQVYRPLMLREHFRCVPDIIGYSNMLSYNGKIKPLREAGSSHLKTATISYRVQGKRNGRAKTNEVEADAIVALIKACMEQPEYADKSFGVISMLGDDQVKLINRKLADAIPLADYEDHQILCGNASNFQGDERDIIFLTMVDSNEADGPLPMASGEGQGANGKAMKQRYNVAVSRAKDQLWVVHSLDLSADLKPGDMRRRLLEYASDPHAMAARTREIEEASDSPFEAEIATSLVAKGYHIVQQLPVGAYRIDMVAISGEKRIAIECDGERWHSGEEKIREDMERQSILERLGWRFIRIRGSEFYRGKNEAIARIVSELNQYGIVPEANDTVDSYENNDQLLSRVKQRALQLLEKTEECETGIELPTLESLPVAQVESEPIEAVPMEIVTPVVEKAVEQPSVSQIPVTSVRTATLKTTNVVQEVHQPTQTTKVIPDNNVSGKNSLAEYLCELGFEVIDKREKGGALWVVGTKTEIQRALKNAEASFGKIEGTFSEGGRATGHRPGWFTKENYLRK